MKTTYILGALLLAASSIFSYEAAAQSNSTYHLSSMNAERKAEMLNISVTVNPKDYHLKLNQRLELTPILRSKTSPDSVVFTPITVAGRNSYYTIQRESYIPDYLLRSGKGDLFYYKDATEWEDWMEYSELELVDETTGCCGAPTSPIKKIPVLTIDFRRRRFTPQFRYNVPAVSDTKDRRIEGKAYINFPVNRTEIYPDYMVNPVELRKILATVDSVRLNPDATVKGITLEGFASPEGPYSNNVRLAKGRTEAVKEYVRKQYTFPASVFHTNSVPEDWVGLRDSVAASVLSDRLEILDFIDNGNVPIEKRNDELRKRFPASYAFLLKNIYPSLRHTNYAIDYEIRVFTDVEEIKRVMKERPENLSLSEFFLAANSYPAGSKEYDEVFRLASIYIPDNDIANLNAANSAMNEGDYERARMLLRRVKSSPDVVYTQAVLEALEGNYEAAKSGFEAARDAGIAEAVEALKQLEILTNSVGGITFSPQFSK